MMFASAAVLFGLLALAIIHGGPGQTLRIARLVEDREADEGGV